MIRVLWPTDLCWGGILLYCPAWARAALIWRDRLEDRAAGMCQPDPDDGRCLRHDLSWRVDGRFFSVTTRYNCEALRPGLRLPRPLLGWWAFPDFGRCSSDVGGDAG